MLLFSWEFILTLDRINVYRELLPLVTLKIHPLLRKHIYSESLLQWCIVEITQIFM